MTQDLIRERWFLIAAGCIAMLALSCKDKTVAPPAAEVEYHYIRDYEYQEGRVFDLGREGDLNRRDIVIKLDLFRETRPPYFDPDAIWSTLAVDPTNPTPTQFTEDSVPVRQIDSLTYEFVNDSLRDLHYVVLDSTLPLGALGLWMIVQRDSLDPQTQQPVIDTIGKPGDTLLLKMLRPSAGFIPSHPCWNMSWRNVYGIPVGGPEELDLRVFKGPAGSESTGTASEFQGSVQVDSMRYIRLLGLDQYDDQGRKIPDNQPDDRLEVVRPDWGLVIFPARKPFDSDTTFTSSSGHTTAVLQDRASYIYTYMSESQKINGSKYFIRYSTPK